MVKDFYKTLEIAKNATEQEIKQAYCTLALKFHPDKNTSTKAQKHFLAISEAFEVLSDPAKRNIYDQFGEEGLKGVPATDGLGIRRKKKPDGTINQYYHGDPRATFAKFFASTAACGDVFDGSVEIGPYYYHDPFSVGKSKDFKADRASEYTTTREVLLTLEELNAGCTKKVELLRQILVSPTETKPLDKILTIDVKPGWPAGTKIIFEREGDQFPDRVPGDVVFVIQELPHKDFKREGSDIHYTAHITLKEALCGVVLRIQTLDGKETRVNTTGKVVRPGTVQRLVGRGLPYAKEPTHHGDLVVTFNIEFPESLTETAIDRLEDTLP